MNHLVFFLAIINLLIASSRFIYCLKSRRIISIVWFLVAYFSFFFLPVAATESYPHIRGYTAQSMTISNARIQFTCFYILAFNLIFLVSEMIFWRWFNPHKKKPNWELPKSSRLLDYLTSVYFLFLLIGGGLYAITTRDFDYKNYVEANASWSMVFLWASTPFITISALRKQYFRALMACIPFLYFAFMLKVRSFALLSLIPVAIIYALQASTNAKANVIHYLRRALVGCGLALILVMSSALIISSKTGGKDSKFSLPDSGMPFGVGVMIELSQKYDIHTEWDGLILYGRNYINPFIKLGSKLFDIYPNEITDPPYVMGQYYDDVPKNFPLRLHYPALWYADAYFAFGKYGLFLATFWAAVLVGWERVMVRSSLIFGVLLPFYSWHAYMLVRGAIAGSSVPVSYALYISFIAALIILGRRLFAKSQYWASTHTRPNRTYLIQTV